MDQSRQLSAPAFALIVIVVVGVLMLAISELTDGNGPVPGIQSTPPSPQYTPQECLQDPAACRAPSAIGLT